MIVVLLASAALTAAIGDHADMTVILAVIAVNSALGVVVISGRRRTCTGLGGVMS